MEAMTFSGEASERFFPVGASVFVPALTPLECELITALEGLRRNPIEQCWCDMAIGHPLMHDHSPACKAARAALENALVVAKP